MMWLFAMIGVGIVALAHMAPTRFLLDAMAGDRAVWSMPRTAPSTVYLTYDDGPNPTTTPDLLDVLAREGVHATFFLIDAHITEETAPIVRRMFEDGHAVGLHSASRRYMLMSPSTLARTLTEAADRIERLAGTRPCRAFRPHAGWRGGQMFEGLRQIDYQLVGWGWMLWDFNWLRAPRTAPSGASRRALPPATSSLCTTATSRPRAETSGTRWTRRHGSFPCCTPAAPASGQFARTADKPRL